MKIKDEGSIVLFITESDEECDWLEENTNAESWQWMGTALVVDHHMAESLLEAVREAGFIL